MSVKKVAISLVSILFMAIGQVSYADNRLNGREAAEICREEINQAYAGENGIEFTRKPASSLKGESYTFWINASEEIAGDTSSMKYQCEITRTGELVELTREPGRWRI